VLEDKEKKARDKKELDERNEQVRIEKDAQEEERKAKAAKESEDAKRRTRMQALEAKRVASTISIDELEELEEVERVACEHKEVADEDDRLRRQQLLDMQAKVVEAIAAESTAISAQNDREDSHWSKQEHRFKLMVHRMTAGAKTADELHQFLTKANRTMTAYAVSFWNSIIFSQTHCRAPSPDDPVRISLFISSCICFPKVLASKPFADRINSAHNIQKTAKKTAIYGAVY
jgi:hypothetical protein